MDKDTTKGEYPAFPIPMDAEVLVHSDILPSGFAKGLTKREYFAAMAMQGLVGRTDGRDRKSVV